MKTPLNSLSTNPFQFIRQCKVHHHFSTTQGIIDQAQLHGPDFSAQVKQILNRKTFHAVMFRGQRELVRNLAEELLNKVLYTQEDFAENLILLMREFGVGVARVEEHRDFFDGDKVVAWAVTCYSPDGWGEYHKFKNHAEAIQLADEINHYGDFDL